MTPTDAHRKVYDLLVNKHPQTGLSREELAELSGLGDRQMRRVLEELRVIAAQKPHPRLGYIIIGYDDQLGVYTYAKTRQQASRMMREYTARLRTMHRIVSAMAAAADAQFGGDDGTVQDALFEAQKALDTRPWS